MINSNDLKCFLVTAKTLHLTRAAQELGLSQPALSHCIKRLEAEVGVELFLRRKDGLILTKAGSYLFQKGQVVCNELEDIAYFLDTGKSSQKKVLSLGMHPSVAAYTLPLVMKETTNFELSLNFGLSKEVTTLVEEGKIDCAIAINPYPHSNLIITPLGEDKFTLWCHKKYKKQPNADLLFFDPQLHQSHFLLRQLEKMGMKFSRHIEVTNLELIAKFVYEGVGVGILPEKVIKNYSPGETLTYHDKVKPFIDKICFVYSAGNKSNPLIKEFREKIQKILK